MTEREREYASAGFDSCEGIENAKTVIVPSTGRTITQIEPGVWEAQPWNDNYYAQFTDLLEALKFATKTIRCEIDGEVCEARVIERGSSTAPGCSTSRFPILVESTTGVRVWVYDNENDGRMMPGDNGPVRCR